jgi:hypothetical protein
LTKIDIGTSESGSSNSNGKIVESKA